MNGRDWREYILPEAYNQYDVIMKDPTLFDTEYETAVRDMITHFCRQLPTAKDPYERQQLIMAIRDWSQALEEPFATPSYSQARPVTH